MMKASILKLDGVTQETPYEIYDYKGPLIDQLARKFSSVDYVLDFYNSFTVRINWNYSVVNVGLGSNNKYLCQRGELAGRVILGDWFDIEKFIYYENMNQGLGHAVYKSKILVMTLKK